MEYEEIICHIEERIGHNFENRNLLVQALIHSSFANEEFQYSLEEDNACPAIYCYERLEFLGDAVLELVVSDLLFSRFPEAHEGDLSRFRAAMVNTEQLAGLARELGLDSGLLLGKGEAASGGHEKPSILAAVYEAVIAAVYLDGGFHRAFGFASRQMQALMDSLTPREFLGDFKTPLQEKIQALLKTTPVYRVVGEWGPDHMKTFEVELWVKGKAYGRGTGRSKKEAEQDAAKQALESGLFNE